MASSSLIFESHFSLKDSYEFVVYRGYFNWAGAALQATFQFSSKHRSLAGPKSSSYI